MYRLFFFHDPPPTDIYTLSLPTLFRSLHRQRLRLVPVLSRASRRCRRLLHEQDRSEEHTSELQSRRDLVCRLLLEKKNNIKAPSSWVTSVLSALYLACSPWAWSLKRCR